MRKYITAPGWSSGLVDPIFADRVDADAIRTSLQECTNFIIEGSGAASLRPQFENVSGWVDWDTVIEAAVPGAYSFSGMKFWPFNFSGTSYLIAIPTTNDYIFRWASSGATVFKGVMGASATSSQVAQIGKSVFVACPTKRAYYVADFTSNTAIGAGVAASYVTFWKEISGTIETVRRITVKITSPLVSGVPAAIPVVGDTVYGADAQVPYGIARRVTLVSDETVTDLALWEYEVLLGQCASSSPTVGHEVNFGVSDCRGEVLTSESTMHIFGTGTFFEAEFDAADSIRFAGSDYVINTVVDDNLLKMTTTVSDRFEGLRAASVLATQPYFTAVGAYQGRSVWAGNARSNTVLESLVGTESTVCFSAAYDPFVIAAAPQIIPDPASPIMTTVTTNSAAIQWVLGGDSLFFGTTNGEYALEKGPIGATPELLPRFKLMGNYGSTASTPVAPFDGRVIMAPRSGGDIIAMEYIDTKDRFSGRVLNPFCSSIISDGASSIAVRPRSDTDTSQKIFVLDAQNSSGLRVGSLQYGSEAVAWSNIRLDADGTTAPCTFYQVVEFDKDVYVIMKYNTDNFAMCRLNYANATTNAHTGAALDFATACTTTGDTSHQITSATDRAFLASRTVGVVATMDDYGQQRTVYGTVTLNASGVFTSTEDLSSVVVGLPVWGRMIPARVTMEDEEGQSIGRKMRLVSVSASVLNTRQLLMNNTTMMPAQVGGVENPLQTTSVKRYYMGWAQDRDIVIEAQPGYSATVKSLTYEVSL